MICKDCAREADNVRVTGPSVKCPTCGKTVSTTSQGAVHTHKGTGRYKFVRCAGSGRQLPWGHAACKGCDCHHKPRGSMNA